jgi:hypothetical protein
MAKNKYIQSPEQLKEYFDQYVIKEFKSPMHKVEYVGKDGEMVNTPLMVPITFEGFELYLCELGIISDLGDYSSNKDGRYAEYATIITHIRKHCFVQNYKGAAVGLFNANLVAKKLGLIATTENTHKIELTKKPDWLTDNVEQETKK